MASTYTLGGIELIADGEKANTWGQITNENWELIEEMVAGVQSISLSGLSTYTLSTTNGVTSNGRHAVIRFTGTPNNTVTVTISPNDLQKVYIIDNTTGEDISLTQGSGANVTVPAGTKKIVYCNGAGSGAAVTEVVASLTASDRPTFAGADLDGAVTINESGADVDFRVESDTDTHALFVEGSSGNVGVGTDTPDVKLSVTGDTTLSDSQLKIYTRPVTLGQRDSNPQLFSYANLVAGSSWSVHKARGTESSPSVPLINDRIGGLNGWAWTGNPAYTDGFANAGNLRYVVDSTITPNASSAPAALAYNSSISGETLRISSTGEVRIAGTSDQGNYRLQVGSTGVWAQGAYVNGSDERMKKNIADLDDGLNVVKQMRPVTYQYREKFSSDTNVQTGFIAQDLQQVLDGKIYKDGVVPEGPQYLNVAYQNLIPILTKAIQEQQAMIEDLQSRLDAANL